MLKPAKSESARRDSIRAGMAARYSFDDWTEHAGPMCGSVFFLEVSQEVTDGGRALREYSDPLFVHACPCAIRHAVQLHLIMSNDKSTRGFDIIGSNHHDA